MSQVRDRASDIGMIGLGVMGSNMALNMADHGFRVSVYNREIAVMERFVAGNPATPGGLVGCPSYESLVRSLRPPRKVVMLIKAGEPVNAVTRELLPLLGAGDVIVDGGNSRFTDTVRRQRESLRAGVHFMGSGVSGGATGARFGPSLMPGGSSEGWQAIEPIWTAIAARVDSRTGKPLGGARPGKPVQGGEPCTAHIGADGSGHFVKMVHNGIEYADMQLIAEAYSLMRNLLGLDPPQLSRVFSSWDEGDLDSYLMEITSDILQQKDPANPRRWFVDAVLDAAGQKGTGGWTAAHAAESGVPAPTIAEAVFARAISALKEERVAAAKQLAGARFRYRGSKKRWIDAVREALYASKICAYAQGFAMMSQARQAYGWQLDLGRIAKIWRGGCIIRARFLQKIASAYERDPALANLLVDPFFKRKLRQAQTSWREVAALAARAGIACPAFMSALSYYDSYRAARLPANLLQAQRDYFGAHTYERVDRPRGQYFHLEWEVPGRPEHQV